MRWLSRRLPRDGRGLDVQRQVEHDGAALAGGLLAARRPRRAGVASRTEAAPTASTSAAWSMRKFECSAAAGVSAASTSSGVRLLTASAIPVIAFVRPGPWWTETTPTSPVTRAQPSAMQAAPSSWRAATKRAPPSRSALVTTRLPEPSTPKTTRTPAAASAAPTASATVPLPVAALIEAHPSTRAATGRLELLDQPAHDVTQAAAVLRRGALTHRAGRLREPRDAGQLVTAAELRGVRRRRVEHLRELLARRHEPLGAGVDERRVDPVPQCQEAVLGQHLGRGDELGGTKPSSSSSRASDCTSATSAAVSSRLVCVSITRISIVPSRGCRRRSHHRKVASGIAPARISRSIAATQSR